MLSVHHELSSARRLMSCPCSSSYFIDEEEIITFVFRILLDCAAPAVLSGVLICTGVSRIMAPGSIRGVWVVILFFAALVAAAVDPVVIKVSLK